MKIKILFFIALPFLAYASEHGGTNYDIVERTLNFLLFFGILVYFAAKPLRALYQSRIDGIANKLESIQEKLRDSKAKKYDALKRVEEAKQNANALIETAKKEAVNLVAKVKKETQNDIANIEKGYKEQKEFEERKVLQLR